MRLRMKMKSIEMTQKLKDSSLPPVSHPAWRKKSTWSRQQNDDEWGCREQKNRTQQWCKWSKWREDGCVSGREGMIYLCHCSFLRGPWASLWQPARYSMRLVCNRQIIDRERVLFPETLIPPHAGMNSSCSWSNIALSVTFVHAASQPFCSFSSWKVSWAQCVSCSSHL